MEVTTEAEVVAAFASWLEADGWAVPDEGVRYGVVVSVRAEPAALRVPSFVRRALSIDVYSVAADGSVVVE